MNGEVCCILGICCPPAEQRAALATWLEEEEGLSPAQAKRLASKLLKHVDLVPKGSVNMKKMAAVKVAETHPA